MDFPFGTIIVLILSLLLIYCALLVISLVKICRFGIHCTERVLALVLTSLLFVKVLGSGLYAPIVATVSNLELIMLKNADPKFLEIWAGKVIALPIY